MQVEIFIGDQIVGFLNHDSQLNRFSFEYSESWLSNQNRFQLNPYILFERPPEMSDESHSAIVRQFFENLLPEGQALDDVSTTHQVSKSNLMGLLMIIGKETSGAINIGRNQQNDNLRPLSKEELSARINARPNQSFTVWDGKVRLSIAGFQDKVAALLLDGEWYLPEGPKYASTHILKPEPVSEIMRGMTSNEFFCMRLAERVNLNVAPVSLIHIPEPVLVIKRFDRKLTDDGVERIHYIDGCQALGLPSSFKYERPHGNGIDVQNIREGASYEKLFSLLERNTVTPAKERMEMLSWIAFNILIGNVDAHAKNISFKSGKEGLSIAPAYDLVSGSSFPISNLDKSYAMAIGDAFRSEDLTPFEWANFAHTCKLPLNLVIKVLQVQAFKIIKVIDDVKQEVLEEGAEEKHVNLVEQMIKLQCIAHTNTVGKARLVDQKLFN
jgi:serine/threonine-protein kinase HipA